MGMASEFRAFFLALISLAQSGMSNIEPLALTLSLKTIPPGLKSKLRRLTSNAESGLTYTGKNIGSMLLKVCCSRCCSSDWILASLDVS